MGSSQLKTLALILLVLIVGIVALTYSKRLGNDNAGDLLFPELKSKINDVTQVIIKKAGDTVTIRNDSGAWALVERQNYPIDTGVLRQLLLDIADARKLEQKTSNPDMYGRLGVEDITADSDGTEIQIAGTDWDESLILGNLAQRSYRYARLSGQQESWLIDQNPTAPGDAGGWLLKEILDIDASRVKSVTIVHSDEETIRIEKEESDDGTFDVLDIPEGRELSYAGVANGIAGALSDLNMQDVAAASETEPDDSHATAVFTMFDGLIVTVRSSIHEENPWIEVSADGSDEATAINDKLKGWSFRLQTYKADQLRRRWDNILKAAE